MEKFTTERLDNMVYGYVNKIIPFSSVDGPGNRTTVFFQGCNFNCIYCHNPETIKTCINCGKCIEVCKTGAIKNILGEIVWDHIKCCNCDSCIKICKNNSSPKIKKITPQNLMNEIEKYKNFIQGITVSGGECTLQEQFIIELFKIVKTKGLTRFIDSNGFKDFKEMTELLSLTDKVMLDVKSWDKSIHKNFIGEDNTNVIENLKYLASMDKLYEVRTVVVPDMFKNEETVYNVSKFIGDNNLNIRYKLIKFRDMGVRDEFKKLESPSYEYMNKLKEIATKNGCYDVVIV